MAKKKEIKMPDSAQTSSTFEDELSSIIVKNLNKEFKDKNQVVWRLDGPQDAVTDIIGWVSTGSSLLDLAISNMPHGGIPVGRITEITGLEGSGKSLIAAHALADTQRQGGVAVFIDTEAAISSQFLQAIGVDLSKLLVIPSETVEDIFLSIEKIINSVRAQSRDRLVTIVVDSLSGASTEQEMDADYGKDGYATAKAIINSKALRKLTNLIARERICIIFTNQLRVKMNAMAFADPYVTSGGKALGFHSSIRLRASSVGAIKQKDWGGVDQIVGNKIKVKVFKNRIGPPHRIASFELFYDSGIDNYSGWIEVLTTYKKLNRAGSYYTYKLNDENVKFQKKELINKFEEIPKLKIAMYKDLCDISIMKYSQNGPVMKKDDMVETEEILDSE